MPVKMWMDLGDQGNSDYNKTTATMTHGALYIVLYEYQVAIIFLIVKEDGFRWFQIINFINNYSHPKLARQHPCLFCQKV